MKLLFSEEDGLTYPDWLNEVEAGSWVRIVGELTIRPWVISRDSNGIIPFIVVNEIEKAVAPAKYGIANCKWSVQAEYDSATRDTQAILDNLQAKVEAEKKLDAVSAKAVDKLMFTLRGSNAVVPDIDNQDDRGRSTSRIDESDGGSHNANGKRSGTGSGSNIGKKSRGSTYVSGSDIGDSSRNNNWNRSGTGSDTNNGKKSHASTYVSDSDDSLEDVVPDTDRDDDLVSDSGSSRVNGNGKRTGGRANPGKGKKTRNAFNPHLDSYDQIGEDGGTDWGQGSMSAPSKDGRAVGKSSSSGGIGGVEYTGSKIVFSDAEDVVSEQVVATMSDVE